MKKAAAMILVLLLTLSGCHGAVVPRGAQNTTQAVTLPE